MCKAEGAEHYITAADRHWRTDGELRAVAEVHQISYTFLCTSELPMLSEGVKNPSHRKPPLRGVKIGPKLCFWYGKGVFQGCDRRHYTLFYIICIIFHF